MPQALSPPSASPWRRLGPPNCPPDYPPLAVSHAVCGIPVLWLDGIAPEELHCSVPAEKIADVPVLYSDLVMASIQSRPFVDNAR